MPHSESDLDYYGRRAMEESAAALVAKGAQASAVHRRMAAAYAIRMREEQVAADLMGVTLAELDDVDDGFDRRSGEDRIAHSA